MGTPMNRRRADAEEHCSRSFEKNVSYMPTAPEASSGIGMRTVSPYGQAGRLQRQ